MSARVSTAVLVSAGRHPVSGTPRACRGDAVAMAVARTVPSRSMHVVHAGSKDEPSLRDYLAYGCHAIDVVETPDACDCVPALAAALGETTIIVAGVRAECGVGSGLLPYRLAAMLGRPVIANALSVRVDEHGREAMIEQFLPHGRRRLVACPLPAIITVHPLAPAQLTYAYARKIKGPISVVSSGTTEDAPMGPQWTLEKAPRRAVRLKAKETRSGHARLHSAIAPQARDGVVVFEGTTVDKAQVILNYLREHKLVDF
jgi:electron transfer flavoprotein beta subunit